MVVSEEDFEERVRCIMISAGVSRVRAVMYIRDELLGDE